MSELYRERVEDIFKNPNFAAAKPDERQAIKIMKDILASKPFEQSLKNANIEILEDFMEKIAAAGNKSSAFSLLINQYFQELIDDFNRIEKAIADSAEGLGKIAGKLNFFAKHLGPVASAIDLGLQFIAMMQMPLSKRQQLPLLVCSLLHLERLHLLQL